MDLNAISNSIMNISSFEHVLIAGGIFVLSTAILYIIYKIIFTILKRASKFTKNDLDDQIIEGLQDPARVLVLICALFLSVSISFPNLQVNGITVGQVAVFLIILDLAFACDRIITSILKWYEEVIAPKTTSKLDEDLLPLAKKIARIIIYIIAGMIGASYIGIEISPLLTGLGIAGLAVALALQDSLGNFFAGINILVDRPVRPGDYVSLDNGISGEVEDVGWRTTKIRTWDGNVVFIPNQKLAQSIITNFYAPDEEYIASFVIGVDYDSDIDEVLKTLEEALKRVQNKNPLVVKDHPVKARFEGFGEHELKFKCFIKVKNYRARFDVLSEVYREIFYLFKEKDIHIPFPVRTVYLYDKTKENEKGRRRKNKKT